MIGETSDSIIKRLGYANSMELHRAYLEGSIKCSPEDMDSIEWKCISPSTLLAVAALKLAEALQQKGNNV